MTGPALLWAILWPKDVHSPYYLQYYSRSFELGITEKYKMGEMTSLKNDSFSTKDGFGQAVSHKTGAFQIQMATIFYCDENYISKKGYSNPF